MDTPDSNIFEDRNKIRERKRSVCKLKSSRD